MNRTSIRLKLFLVTFSTILAILVVAYLYLRDEIRRDVTAHIRNDLTARLSLVSQHPSLERGAESRHGWDQIADTLGKLAGARFTIIRADGTVVGDSRVSPKGLETLDNHAGRPEVEQALRDGLGSSIRYSTTLKTHMLYVAQPWDSAQFSGAVLRMALPLTQVESATASLERRLAFAALIGVLIALVASTLTAEFGSRKVRSLTNIAQAISKGDLSPRYELGGGDEFAILGETLNGLAENLSTTLGQLTTERDRLDRVLRSMHEGVLMVDQSATIQVANAAAREMLLLDSNVVGENFAGTIRDAELYEMIEAALKGENTSTELKLRGPAPRLVLVDARRLRGRKGALVVLVDITDQRRLETIRQEFVANASHELRTPIAAILSAVETLLGAASTDQRAQEQFTQMIARNARRLQNLVDDLLALSQLEAGKISIELVPVEVRSLTEAVFDSLIPAARKKHTELVCRVPSRALALADTRGLEHVLVNLVDNAIKYCPQDSRVVIETSEKNRSLVISVRDDGPGIDAEHLERVFERFYRVDTGRSRDLGGTGLGLSIVKHWVEAMSGSVRVSSKPNEGTEFQVTLELATSKAAELNPAPDSPVQQIQ